MDRIDDSTDSNSAELMEGYLEMARDVARERAAEEWSEGLIGDVPAA